MYVSFAIIVVVIAIVSSMTFGFSSSMTYGQANMTGGNLTAPGNVTTPGNATIRGGVSGIDGGGDGGDAGGDGGDGDTGGDGGEDAGDEAADDGGEEQRAEEPEPTATEEEPLPTDDEPQPLGEVPAEEQQPQAPVPLVEEAPPATAPTTGAEPAPTLDMLAAGEEITNPYEPLDKKVSDVITDPYEPLDKILTTNAPLDTLVKPSDPCCAIEHRAIEPDVKENLDGIAKQISAIPTQPEAEAAQPGATPPPAELEPAANSDILEQVVIRSALKGADTTQVTDTIAQQIQAEPDGPLPKAINNVAKQSLQLNNAIDVGAAQIANGVPPIQALEQLDLHSSEPCCGAGQPQTSLTTPTATPKVDPVEPISGLLTTNAPLDTLANYGEPCCQVANRALDSTLKQQADSLANTIANNPEIASAAGATTPEAQQNLAGSVSDVVEQLVIRSALKGADAAQVTNALVEAVQQDPAGTISQILTLNAAKENAQINTQTDLIAGQLSQGGGTPTNLAVNDPGASGTKSTK